MRLELISHLCAWSSIDQSSIKRDNVTRWIYFLEVLNLKQNFLNEHWRFWLSSMKKIPSKVFACFYKLLTNYENPASNRFQRSCFGFPIATCDSKSCSEGYLWSYICSRMLQWIYITKNRPTVAKESLNRNVLRLLKRSLEIVSVFKELSRNFKFIFLLSLKIISVCKETIYLKV